MTISLSKVVDEQSHAIPRGSRVIRELDEVALTGFGEMGRGVASRDDASEESAPNILSRAFK